MKVRYHIAASLAVGALVWAGTRSVLASVTAVTTGILVDLDHLYDYFRSFGWRPDLRHFFRASYDGLYDRVYLPLHSWELIALTVAAAAIAGWPDWMTGLVAGWGHHLLLDQLFNMGAPGAYFFLFRRRHQFAYKRCFPQQWRKGHPESSSVTAAPPE